MKLLKLKLFIALMILSLTAFGQQTINYENLFEVTKHSDNGRNMDAKITRLNLDPASLTKIWQKKDDKITIVIPFSDGNSFEVELIKSSIFSENFKVVLSSGKPYTGELGVHYSGHIAGNPSSIVAISIFKNQLHGLFSNQTGNFNLGKIKNSEQYALYLDKDLDFNTQQLCTTHDRNLIDLPESGDEIVTRSNKVVEVLFELDYDVAQTIGSIDEAGQYMMAVIGQGIKLYANDGITVKASELKIWDQPSPYVIGSSDVYLESYCQNTDNFNGHLAVLVSTKSDLGGGLANSIGGFCDSNPDLHKCVYNLHGDYKEIPTYSWDCHVWVHETGHLLGSRHTHACVWNGNNTQIDDCASVYQYGQGATLEQLEGGDCFDPNNPVLPSNGGFIMSYCGFLQDVGTNLALGFGQLSGNFIRSAIQNASCITGGGSSTLSVDPQFVQIPSEGGCKSINVTATGAWAAEYDQAYPPFFLTDPFNITGNGNGAIEFCAGKNVLPVPFYSVMYVYNGTTDIQVVIRQDSVHTPTAVFYPSNEKISPFTGETFTLDILTNTDWKLVQKDYDKWVTILSSKSGTKNAEFTVKVTKNTTPLNRYSRIAMVYNNGLDTTYFTISQPSENSGYLNVPSEITVSGSAGAYSFKVSSDLDWEVADKPAWVIATPVKGKKDLIVTLEISDNNTGNPQYGTVTFVAKTMTNDSIVKTVNINQLKMRSTDSEITERIYPNPTHDQVSIELSAVNEEKLDVKIFDAAGRLIKVLENSKPIFGAYYNSYQVSDLAPGFYTMDIRHGSSVLKEKLVILN